MGGLQAAALCGAESLCSQRGAQALEPAGRFLQTLNACHSVHPCIHLSTFVGEGLALMQEPQTRCAEILGGEGCGGVGCGPQCVPGPREEGPDRTVAHREEGCDGSCVRPPGLSTPTLGLTVWTHLPSVSSSLAPGSGHKGVSGVSVFSSPGAGATGIFGAASWPRP